METVVGESDWLDVRHRHEIVIEQTAPRFDRCAMPGLSGCGLWVLDVNGQRFGVVVIDMGPDRLDVGGRLARGSPGGRQRVFDVVVVIVEAIPEAVVMVDQIAALLVVWKVVRSVGLQPNPSHPGLGTILVADAPRTYPRRLVVAKRRAGEADHE